MQSNITRRKITVEIARPDNPTASRTRVVITVRERGYLGSRTISLSLFELRGILAKAEGSVKP